MSMASRVVPGNWLTIARSLRTMALMSEDLPTLGRPTIAIAVGPSSRSGDFRAPDCDAFGTKERWVSALSIISTSRVIPRLCSALTETTFSKPNESNSAASGSCFSLSILFITSTTGFCLLRNIRASSPSIGDNPSLASTTKRRRSLSRSAFSAARSTCCVSSDSPAPKIPPVSHKVNGRSPRVQVAERRSRVIPGRS